MVCSLLGSWALTLCLLAPKRSVASSERSSLSLLTIEDPLILTYTALSPAPLPECSAVIILPTFGFYLVNVCISLVGLFNKVLQTVWLRATEMYCFVVRRPDV